MTTVYILLGFLIFFALSLFLLTIKVRKDQQESKNKNTIDFEKNNKEIVKDVESIVKIESASINSSMNASTDNVKGVTERMDGFMRYSDQKMDKLREEVNKSLAETNQNNIKALQENRQELNTRIQDMTMQLTKSLDSIRNETNINLKAIQDKNEKQLEKMRETVDEKLSTTLDERFNQSFKIVGDRLQEITKGFGELQQLQTGVNDIKNIFKNVKTRGTWGEVALDNLLSQILTQDQYDKQVKLKPRSDDMVDFAIKLPGKGDGTVYLPIDAKFPLEDYQLLVEASEEGNKEKAIAARKALENRIKGEAKSIRDKYINIPKTTDFAIMYLPIEGLYAEVVKIDGLIERLQLDYRIIICGPTTIAALLNSLQMGFRSVAIEKRSTEIGKLLAKFIKDFDKFTQCLTQARERIDKVQKSLDDADKRTEIIKKSLDKVEQYNIEAELNDEDYMLESGENNDN